MVSSHCPDNVGHGVELGQIKSGEKIFFNITYPVFHAPLFITLSHATRDDFEAKVIGEVEVFWVKHRGLPYDPFEYGAI